MSVCMFIKGNCKYDIERRTPVVGITGYNTIPANDLEATLQGLHFKYYPNLQLFLPAMSWKNPKPEILL